MEIYQEPTGPCAMEVEGGSFMRRHAGQFIDEPCEFRQDRALAYLLFRSRGFHIENGMADAQA